jgi:NAD(P)-dependent dehydrogenase (short-subunit alcohol dehydrogenase family)
MDLVRSLDEMTPDDWQAVMNLNLTGPMLAARAALPHLRAAGGGSIVTVASGAALLPLRHRTAYCASKAGLTMFTKALAMEAAQSGIRANVVCPGAVETDMLRGGFGADEAAERATVAGRYALGRIAAPSEIAEAILWLTSAEASFVTGAAVAVDGGRTFH